MYRVVDFNPLITNSLGVEYHTTLTVPTFQTATPIFLKFDKQSPENKRKIVSKVSCLSRHNTS